MLIGRDGICAALVLHVDDMLIAYDEKRVMVVDNLVRMRKMFNFGKWTCLDNNKSLFYCGGKLTRNGNAYTLDFEEYVKKICPLTVEKGRNQDEKLNERDVSKVRA